MSTLPCQGFFLANITPTHTMSRIRALYTEDSVPNLVRQKAEFGRMADRDQSRTRLTGFKEAA
jgi:hypothetical protein